MLFVVIQIKKSFRGLGKVVKLKINIKKLILKI
jgi:hypothetical protein